MSNELIDANEAPTDIEELGEDEEELTHSKPGSLRALDFVDDSIDAVDYISELSVEALVALNVLRITKHPEDVLVNITKSQRLIIMEFDVHKSDLAALIGKEGNTINSVRSIARAAAGNSEIKYVIYPLEEGRPPKIYLHQQDNRTRNSGRRFHRKRRS
jgi:predicted RNA-binding protein YlqC (UPF0109 family)